MQKKVAHLVPVLIGPLTVIMEQRIQEMLMIAYDAGYKDGKESADKNYNGEVSRRPLGRLD
jgi:hypothetical protein